MSGLDRLSQAVNHGSSPSDHPNGPSSSASENSASTNDPGTDSEAGPPAMARYEAESTESGNRNIALPDQHTDEERSVAENEARVAKELRSIGFGN